MNYKQSTGKQGEEAAKQLLSQKSFQILERNWRWRKAEVDIIAMDGDVLVFVEVKSRHTSVHGKPELSISPRKRTLLLDAATRYMEKIDHEWAIRFDVISVIIQNKTIMQIEHYPDSFSPWDEGQ